jgi:hypothetical protein
MQVRQLHDWTTRRQRAGSRTAGEYAESPSKPDCIACNPASLLKRGEVN